MIEKRLGYLLTNVLFLSLPYFLIIVDHFDATNGKVKTLVEKIGVQTQTSRRDPMNLDQRRICLGPNLYFRADGSKDLEPIHYFG